MYPRNNTAYDIILLRITQYKITVPDALDICSVIIQYFKRPKVV